VSVGGSGISWAMLVGMLSIYMLSSDSESKSSSILYQGWCGMFETIETRRGGVAKAVGVEGMVRDLGEVSKEW
jgi:hypothetical protein